MSAMIWEAKSIEMHNLNQLNDEYVKTNDESKLYKWWMLSYLFELDRLL